MEMLKRVPQQTEKPGRLQLAIIEWQRQLIEKREARKGEALIHDQKREKTGVTA
jgi:hypothetical protein